MLESDTEIGILHQCLSIQIHGLSVLPFPEAIVVRKSRERQFQSRRRSFHDFLVSHALLLVAEWMTNIKFTTVRPNSIRSGNTLVFLPVTVPRLANKTLCLCRSIDVVTRVA